MERAPLRSPQLDPSFASDNTAGICPEVMERILEVNNEAALPYGADEESLQLSRWAHEEFGPAAEILPVFNGTGANVVALQALLPRWGAAICTRQAHINTDEGAAPERVGAVKLLAEHDGEGKLRPEHILRHARSQGFVHAAQPLAVSITQSTELGTTYSPEEIRTLCETAHGLDMSVHMDGSRICNAAAAWDAGLGEMSAELGVDVLSLGATKNGALAAEAVVVINPERVQGAEYIRKYSMQLASKQRFISAQLNALFATGLWRVNAAHANATASALGERLAQLPGVTLSRSTQVNAVFPEMPQEMADRIQSRYLAHLWDTAPSGKPVLRLMCSWQTSADDINMLVETAASTL